MGRGTSTRMKKITIEFDDADAERLIELLENLTALANAHIENQEAFKHRDNHENQAAFKHGDNYEEEIKSDE